MKKITHPHYKDYPEQPFISSDRDLDAWEKTPEKFPYGYIEKKDMIRIEEGLLPGDMVLLWRINFGNITNEMELPQYFEYRYGVDTVESFKLLHEKDLIRDASMYEVLGVISVPILKRILKDKGYPVTGKREDIVQRVRENISEESLAQMIPTRLYVITDEGKALLDKYPEIIKRHGPKKM